MRTREPDEACARAAGLARAAVESVAPDAVGEHIGVEAEADRVVTHFFACLDPAYPGWRWAVTLARASHAKTVTVDESVLLPGPGAMLAPPWVPWRERLRPGDVGVGDILPAPPDDERLVPAVALDGGQGPGGPEAAEAVADLAAESRAGIEPGEERLLPPQARVLSPIGRDDAALRWYTGEHGPQSPLAFAAPGRCASCGFFIRLGRPLGQVFGACANAYAPDDGRVVSVDHGCGAHSEGLSSPAGPLAEEARRPSYDLVDLPGVSVEETDFESLSD